ncbi:hypothetical protein VPHK379_0023 [Vibrio phage K379]|nr:hypothetical protein SIPHO049v1_p0007 [Vibrio phage PS14A.1]
MAISQRELFEIAQTHLEEPSNLLHFKAGFAKGEHQLIMVFESGEKVVNTGWGCQEENVKKLNDLMGLTAPERGYQTEVYSTGVLWHWKVRNAHGALVSKSEDVYTSKTDAQKFADAEVEDLIYTANQLKVAR